MGELDTDDVVFVLEQREDEDYVKVLCRLGVAWVWDSDLA